MKRIVKSSLPLLGAVALAVSCTNPLAEKVHTAVEVAKGAKIVVVIGSTMVASGATQSFGQVYVGESKQVTFTVTNAGKADLTLTSGAGSVMLSGTDCGQFSITGAPSATTIPTGQGATFTVAFSPTSAGTKTADLAIVSNDPSTGSYNIGVTGVGLNNGQVAKPTFDHVQGTYNANISVILGCDTAGAVIHYTTDNSDATASSAEYDTASAGIPVNGQTGVSRKVTIKAIGVKKGMADSVMASSDFTINYDAPSVPQNVQASPGNGEITLTWSSVAGAQFYSVYYALGTTVTKETGTMASNTILSSPYTVTGLSPGSQYALIVTAANSYGESAGQSGTYIATAKTAIATPTFSPDAGAYVAATVVIACANSGATIRWTTDNPPLTSSAGTIYISPLILGGPVTLQAIAYETGYPDSQVATAVYTFVPPDPPGSVTTSAGAGKVTVSWGSVTGATSYTVYCKAGTAVSKGSNDQRKTNASSPCDVTGLLTGTQYAFMVTATGVGGESIDVSPVLETTYAQVAAPQFTPNGGSCIGSQSVQIATSTSGASIRYTTDGSTPSESAGTPYSAPFTITSNATLKAMAYKTGMVDSTVATSNPFTFLTPSITSVTPGARQATVSWTAVSGASSYTLYCKQGSSVSTTSFDQRIPNATSPWTVGSLSDNTQYAFIVTAVGGAESAPGNLQTATTAPAPPTITGVVPGAGQATVSWSSVSGASSYTLYCKQGSSVSTTSFDQRITGATSPRSVAGLSDTTQYAFIVTAAGAGGESVASNLLTATTAPASPVLTNVTPGMRQAIVNWNPVSGASSYNVYWKQGSSVSTTSYDQRITYASSPFTVPGLMDGTLYAFIVASVGSTGAESAASNPLTATTEPLPPAITGLNPGVRQAIVNWNPVSGASSYNVYCKAGPFVSTGSYDQRITYANPPCTVSSLSDATPYAFIVTAVWAGGEVVSITQTTTTAPAAPAIMSVTPGARQATVSWIPVPGATSYTLYCKQGPFVSTTAYDQRQTGATSPCTVGGLSDNSPYAFIVTAVGSGGEGLASGIQTSTTAPAPPSITGAVGGSTQVAVSWNTVSGASSYTVYCKQGSWVSTTSYDQMITNATSPCTVGSLSDNTQYAFVVTAVGSGGAESAASGILTATTAPAPPTITSVAGGINQATINWSSESGSWSFNLYYKHGSSVSTTSYDQKMPGVWSPANSFPLSDSSQYAFIVTAVGQGGAESAASNLQTATTAPMITSIMPAGSTLAVSWNPVDNAMHYTVYYKQGGGPVSKSDYGGRLDFASSGIEVSGLQSGMMYAFVVTAFCPGEPPGEGPDSPIMTAVAH